MSWRNVTGVMRSEGYGRNRRIVWTMTYEEASDVGLFICDHLPSSDMAYADGARLLELTDPQADQ